MADRRWSVGCHRCGLHGSCWGVDCNDWTWSGDSGGRHLQVNSEVAQEAVGVETEFLCDCSHLGDGSVKQLIRASLVGTNTY